MLSIQERAAEIRRIIAKTACQLELSYRRKISSNSVYPTDEPRGAVEGPDPFSVAILGDWNSVGLGVITFDLSLGACFSRALAHRTGHGVNWQLVPVEGFHLAAVPDSAAASASKLADVDVAIIQLGALESMMFVSPRQWSDGLVAAIEAVQAAVGTAGCVVIAAIPPIEKIGSLTRFTQREIGRECRELNAVSRTVAERYPRCQFTEFPEGLAAEVWIAETNDLRFSHSYAVWGASIAREVVLEHRGETFAPR
ncbi:hypothetical protein [Lacisediminihabitans changchengi]|uniref:SGNH/GDSL hydrolase family protein n=1 Tax=Lacisediminihabitans changchengi TaxID=2787634 RepID=A0A934W0T9_9MICO|nr:hypothetical protein [Lacisediminihabitans changchengi]MBK4346188.1 hypothetical protein [Lacisediminihabitans changchengi]